MEKKYVVDGYAFPTAAAYDRAMRERETIAYLNATVDMADMRAVYRVYRDAVEKQAFTTVFGLVWMKDLQERLIGSALVEEQDLEPIPCPKA